MINTFEIHQMYVYLNEKITYTVNLADRQLTTVN
jgi:hypothetical protein